jgi:SAM-dependent methyltransferase
MTPQTSGTHTRSGRTLRALGLGTSYHAMREFLLRTRDSIYELRGAAFDAWHGVETDGKVPVTDLDIPNHLKTHAVRYQPTKIAVFNQAMRGLPDRDLEKFAFVDFGCGKGRCLLLSTQFPFSKIVGIEVSGSLSDVARDNAGRFRSGEFSDKIEVQQAAAAEARLPRCPSVYFFYNPFDRKVMAETLDNILSVLEETGNEAFIVYVNPMHDSLMPESGFSRVSSGRARGEDWAVWHRPAIARQKRSKAAH